MKNALQVCLLLLSLAISTTHVYASDEILDTIPIKEVTIFKDGHAYVLHEGSMPVDEEGNVTFDKLPKPVLGTFWAYSKDDSCDLNSVISTMKIVPVQCTALTVGEMLKANQGKKVYITEQGIKYIATILRVPERSTEELTRLSDNQNNTSLPQTSNMVMLQVDNGIKMVDINRIQEITFAGNPTDKVSIDQLRHSMTMNLNWKRDQHNHADVGMAYVQKGIRWIPNYKIELDGNGNAIIKLQATIINELADIENVTAHLVVGVPKFAFAGNPDPISFQKTIAQLSQHFQSNSSTAYSFMNSITSQRAINPRYSEVSRVPDSDSTIDLGPEVQGTEKNEDLFIFTINYITLKKGQRMVIPLAEYSLEYKDVYVIDIPFAPPLEMRRNFNSNQHLELAKLYHAPKAMHTIRFNNNSEYPLTTAPALVMKDGKVISQGMMKFTAIGQTGNLELTTALDLSVKVADEVSEKIPKAIHWDGYNYMKVKMDGTIEIKNYGKKNVVVEVKRSVLGNIDSADQDGNVLQLGRGYDSWTFTGGIPSWWNWCNWPYWWYH
ncbi:MAG: hypothetical protein KAS23_08880, partial [Anaerohalosphaera sp.]|nr:hypothetical protein [Anaerohalosphaera sp.]